MYEKLTNKLKAGFDPGRQAIEEVLACFSPALTGRNQLLLSPGEVCKNYYFIETGALRVFTINKEGIENSRFFAFEGNFCTALPSFINQEPAMEYLQSIEKSRLLSISRSSFFEMVEKHRFFSGIYLNILETGFINAQKRIYGFQGFDAIEKVRWVIKSQPELLLRVSNKMAASYLGISPSTLSRMKAKL